MQQTERPHSKDSYYKHSSYFISDKDVLLISIVNVRSEFFFGKISALLISVLNARNGLAEVKLKVAMSKIFWLCPPNLA